VFSANLGNIFPDSTSVVKHMKCMVADVVNMACQMLLMWLEIFIIYITRSCIFTEIVLRTILLTRVFKNQNKIFLEHLFLRKVGPPID